MPSSRYVIGSLPWYSVLVVSGIVAALLIGSLEEKRKKLPVDTLVDLALWVIPCGVIGARLYYVAFAWSAFAADPVSILYVWNGGLAIYGGLLGGLLGIWVYSRVKGIAFPVLTDMLAPGVALAQAIGRWGNFFNMEAYGQVVIQPWLQHFPLAVQIPEAGGLVWHQATFFYESCWDLIIFAALFSFRKQLRRDGDATLWYLLLYGCGRQIIEGMRMDSLMSFGGGVRISRLLALAMAAAILIYFTQRLIREHRERRVYRILMLQVLLLNGLLMLVGLFLDGLFIRLLISADMIMGCLLACILTGKEERS